MDLFWGMWCLPGPGVKLMSPALAGRFLTTEPAVVHQGNPPRSLLKCVRRLLPYQSHLRPLPWNLASGVSPFPPAHRPRPRPFSLGLRESQTLTQGEREGFSFLGPRYRQGGTPASVAAGRANTQGGLSTPPSLCLLVSSVPGLCSTSSGFLTSLLLLSSHQLLHTPTPSSLAPGYLSKPFFSAWLYLVPAV